MSVHPKLTNFLIRAEVTMYMFECLSRKSKGGKVGIELETQYLEKEVKLKQ
jgi:hypothetical protein